MAVSILRGSHIPTVGPTGSRFYYPGQGFQVSYFSETDDQEQFCFIDPSTQPPTHPPAPPSKPNLVCQHVTISWILSAHLATHLFLGWTLGNICTVLDSTANAPNLLLPSPPPWDSQGWTAGKASNIVQ